MSVQGVKEIQRAFHSRKKAHAKGLIVGLYKAGLFLQRMSQKVVPVARINGGNLKGSAFTRIEGTGFKTAVIVGYTADYAIYVHEIIENRHAAGKQAKFLSGPLQQHRDYMGAMIVKEVEKAK